MIRVVVLVPLFLLPCVAQNSNKAIPEDNGQSAVVSVNQLRRPVSARAKKIFGQAIKLFKAGEYPKAIALLQTTVKDKSATPFSHLLIGSIYLKTGELQLAMPQLREAVDMMPGNSDARTYLACAMLLSGQSEAAEEQVRHALQLDDTNLKSWCVLGAILVHKGKTEEGIEDLRLATRAIPNARLILADYYELHDRIDAAASELREYVLESSGEDKVMAREWLMRLER